MRIGYLSLKERQEGEYVQHMAKEASKLGYEFVQFTPFNIQPATEEIMGWKYVAETEQWEKTTFEIPNYIYDRCFYSPSIKSKQAKPIVDWLKKRKDITFLGYGLPGKWETYQALATDESLNPYIPKTKKLLHLAVFFEELRKTRKLVIKPIHGSRGINIYFITLSAYSISVSTQKQKEVIETVYETRDEFFEWLQPIVESKGYVYQNYLDLQTKSREAFDLRILLQKNEKGEWQAVGKGVRIGQPNSIVANLSAGSNAVPFEEWITQFNQRTALILQQDIETICKQLPVTLEKNFLPLFEIGLDLGIDSNQAIWILDVNSKPGRKVLLQTDPSIQQKLYSAPIQYCLHLQSKSKSERSEIK